MHNPELVIRGRRVFTSGCAAPASIHITRGYISSISVFEDVPAGSELIEASPDSIIIPGLVDTHVHVNEPGRTEWEGFETATRAAAAGGVTTVVDMPLNSIPATTTVEALNAKLNAARGKLHVDVGFWGGVVPGNTMALAELWQAGVVGFKCFLIHSGVAEFPNVNEQDLRQAMPVLARLGAILIVHAELAGSIEAGCQSINDEPRLFQSFLSSRPREAENGAVELMIRLCRETGCPVHIVHHSSADALPMLQEARADGLPITIETCPHYLHFAAEEIPAGATEFKCCPPIREAENRERLWQALRDCIIDFVVSDHSPCPPEMKLGGEGDFMKAWGGIASLQLRLPVMWTEASARGFGIENLVRWLCSAPAAQVGMAHLKGTIAIGCDADIVIWNPDRSFTVEPSMLYHRHKLTPYAGEVLRGEVEKTFVRGQMVYDGGTFASVPLGQTILRS